MSRIQRFFQKLLPPHVAQKLEAESRKWMLRCKRCGAEHSFWELGGIRYASRRRKLVWIYCESCARRTTHLLYHTEEAASLALSLTTPPAVSPDD